MADNETQLGTICGRSYAFKRFADALLRLGATQITLRISDPSSGDTGSQLGLEPPPAEDIQISPAMVKALPPAADGKRRFQASMSATALRAIAKNYGVEDIPAWLLVAQGVVLYNRLWHIESVAVDQVGGSTCLYHLTATE